MIRVQSVTHAYPHTTALVLDDVNLELPRGQVTALVGPNGAGKSTLLAAASRLLVPAGGQVLLDDLDIATAPPRDVARRLAVLRQESRIGSRLSVIDLVRFGRFPHSQGRLTAADHEIVERYLHEVELTALRDRFLDELSGGQRQRAFIAMVLAQETDFVFLDEPLNNLDMVHAVATMKLLRSAADDLGRTVVMVVHDVNVAAAFADEIVGMREGRIVATGSPREFVTPAVLRDVFGLDVAVHEIDGVPVALHWRCERPAVRSR